CADRDRGWRVFHVCRERLHAGERLDPRLRLARFRRGGAEALDEGGDMRALGFLALARFLLDDQLLAPLAVELREAAAIKFQLLLVEMQDERDRGIEEVAIMAD